MLHMTTDLSAINNENSMVASRISLNSSPAQLSMKSPVKRRTRMSRVKSPERMID